LQRLSNNKPKFTDEECIAIYVFGIINHLTDVMQIYDFTKQYYSEWFPLLPKYHAFNYRVCMLSEIITEIAGHAINNGGIRLYQTSYVMDSMPIVVASQKRSGRAKAASGFCDKGYCSSKSMYYHGVKLHVLAQKRQGTIPFPYTVELTPASESDLTAAKQYLGVARNMSIYADKIYRDGNWQAKLTEQNVSVITPAKLKKGQIKLSYADKLMNESISRARQCIESFFSWLQEKTNIHRASKVRSVAGLVSFVFARLFAALFMFNF